MIKSLTLTPIQKFIKIKSLGGILLFTATVIAMIWANSSYSETYQAIWKYKLGITTDYFQLNKPLILWVNDGLMAIFFFFIGLEIKRELLIGELNSIKKATFPLIAAIGGMVVPVGMFLYLNSNPETVDGWGIPMATDIAFTLAILQLLGNRIPLSLKIFLTAFAIVDDLGAVLIIAIFYSHGINWLLIAYAIIPFAILAILAYNRIYIKYLTLLLGIIIWLAFLKSGIHPTIAGVLVAFTIPIRQKIDETLFTERLSNIVKKVMEARSNQKPILTKPQIEQMDNLEDLIEEFQSPLQHLEHKLQGWVDFFIMPIFALANAGIVFSADIDLDMPLIINITIALFFGKFIGVALFSFVGLSLNIAELPENVNKLQIIGVSILAGVGFTMSVFVATLAFENNFIFVDSAKAGILLGSIFSSVFGYLILKFSSKVVRS